MTIDPAVVPGLLLLAAELAALAAVGYVIVRAVLRQDDERMALAQGLVVGPALWGVIVNFVLYVVPGLAGAAVGWGVMLALGAVLAWRAPRPIRPRPRTLAGFALAVLALFWIALASRQLLTVQDWSIQLGLAASIQAGTFPPELPWNPGTPVHYHHAPSLLVGLLAPPVGPDLAFVSELLDSYGWTSFILVVAVAVLRRGSWPAMLLVAPLLLTYGAWTVIWVGNGLLEVPVPVGLPEAGLRTSLADVYWPSVALPPKATPWGQVLADIWKPAFTLGYALAFVVLERAARCERRSWPAAVTLAGLVGSSVCWQRRSPRWYSSCGPVWKPCAWCDLGANNLRSHSALVRHAAGCVGGRSEPASAERWSDRAPGWHWRHCCSLAAAACSPGFWTARHRRVCRFR